MKKAIIVLVVAFALGIGLYAVKGNAQMGPGMMGGSGYGQSYCPNCGRPMGPGGGYGMGPGMMGPGYGMGSGMMGPGYGMGPGMMHQGWGMGSGMMGPGHGMGPGMMGPGYGYGRQYQQPQKPMEEDDAKELLENYLKSTRNPNLKLGKIKDTGSTFEAEIITKDDSLVDKIAVDKYTGWMRSAY
jgi:hypothetical protein